MRVLPLIFLFLLASRVAGQDINFSHLSVDDGLSQNSVLCITQDARGFMWYGTRFGLNRYDASKIITYKSTGKPGAISNDYILSLFSDSKGNLWAGTRKGLNKYLPATDMFEEVPFSATPSARNKYVNCIFETHDKKLLVGISNYIYVINNSKKPVLILFPHQVKGIIYAIFEDSRKNIWIGTDQGLVKLAPHNNSFSKTVFTKDNKNLYDNIVYSITEDENGLWFGTLNGGLHLYNERSGSFQHFAHGSNKESLINDHIRRLLPDDKGNLWIGTQEGISVMNIAAKKFTSCVNDPLNPGSLSQNSVHSLYKDKSGIIWIGTFFGGVNSYSPFNTDFTTCSSKSLSCRLNNNVISSIVEDNNKNLWIGTEGGGLNFLDRQTGVVTYFKNDPGNSRSLGSNLVKNIYKDKGGNLWIGTHGGGINLLENLPGNHSFKRYSYSETMPDNPGLEISCMLEDSKGYLWIGTELRGLKSFTRQGNGLKDGSQYAKALEPLRSATIVCLFEASDKKIWISSNTGLFVFDKGKLKPIESAGLKHINCITEDDNNLIWLGTNNDGLLYYTREGQALGAYTKSDGLSDNNVTGILQDDQHRLWISTGNGLNKFNPVAKTFNNYSTDDGLAGNAFNYKAYYKSADGKMFFGGYDGLTSFYPDNIKENTIVPEVVFTSLSLADSLIQPGDKKGILSKSISLSDELELRYNQNMFSIGFAALNFIKPAKNKYAYQLEGLDKNWIYTSKPVANFINLPPGEYKLLVKGSNNDGIWGKPVSLDITILPPFWKTWWAYCLYALLLIVSAFLITRFFYLRALYKRNNELTQLKLNFFTNISHEIRTHLALILGPAEKLIKDAEERPKEKAQLQTIKTNSESLLQLVNELMDFRKAETGHLPLHVSGNNLVTFTHSIYTSFLDAAAAKKINMQFNHTSEDIEIWFDKEQMKKVLSNLFSNAIKFTPDTGFININIEEQDDYINIIVANSGKGIAKENIDKLFDNYFQESDNEQQNTGYGIGLALSKSIIDMHGGNINVSSNPGVNENDYVTTFTARLLKGNKHFGAEQINTIPADKEYDRLPGMPVPGNIAEDVTVNGARQTILLVEDNKAMRSFIRESLQDHYAIIESTNGVSGMNNAFEHIPDLIICDVMMPGMDGLTLSKKLKSDIRSSHIPVILLTAKSTVADHVSGLQTGADIYLTKPFSTEVLELQIRNLFASKERLRKQFSQNLLVPQSVPAITALPKENDTAPLIALHPLDEAFIKNIIDIIEENMNNPDFGIAMLSKKAAMSQPVLFKKIKAITGMSANDFVKSLRFKKACLLLLENRYTVYEVAYMVGYENSKYFSREFKKEFGKTPSEYAGGI